MLNRISTLTLIALGTGVLGMPSTANAQTTWFVDDDAGAGGTGTSWISPFDDLQDALDVATGSDVIHVAGGTYVPSVLFDPSDPNPSDPRNTTFRLTGEVEVYGGYAGLADPGNPDTRDISAYESTLSGDLAGNDGPDFANNEENAYHVVYAIGVDVAARLDGFTITAGNANHAELPYRDGGGLTVWEGATLTVATCTFLENFAHKGGGLYINASSATLVGCAFDGNLADTGGGMRNYGEANPTVTGCVFEGNHAVNKGGGMANADTCAPLLVRCTFSGNSTNERGGGMSNMNTCAPVLVGCTFVGNSSDTSAGGVYNTDSSSPVLINCTFDGNSAGTSAGAMLNREGSSPTITNCLFVNNSAVGNGGVLTTNQACNLAITNCTFSGNSAGLSGGSIFMALPTSTTISNSIFWGDTPQAIYSYTGSPVITYCDIEGGWPGTGNIDADPLFVDPDGSDDDPNTWEDNDYRLSSGSPCIDAGDNTAVPLDIFDLDNDGDTDERIPFDLDGYLRFVDDPATEDTGVPDPPDYPNVVDMGAYEFGLFADLDGDCDVDLADLAELLGHYGDPGPWSYEDGDLDGDGDVDLADLAELLGAYGTTCD